MYDFIELKDYTIEDFIKFIEQMYTESNHKKVDVLLNLKGRTDEHRFLVSCYNDYTKGVIVKITPEGCVGKQCCISDPQYKQFVEKELEIGFNAHY